MHGPGPKTGKEVMYAGAGLYQQKDKKKRTGGKDLLEDGEYGKGPRIADQLAMMFVTQS